MADEGNNNLHITDFLGISDRILDEWRLCSYLVRLRGIVGCLKTYSFSDESQRTDFLCNEKEDVYIQCSLCQ